MSSLDRLTRALADRYRIERELGAGGMATVYLAQDLKHHRRVAIKVLHADLSAVLGPERFHKEIELTAGLQHPHILPLFDSGGADGLLYYVMPHVEGETLRTRLTRETQLPVADAVRIASEVADALEYAHRHGVIHRDIKPENILLRDGHALVSDFGIALAVVEAGGERMTQTGTSLGTPQYMAPEQAMGERHIDGRADVYALGVVTYEMLVGEPPFTGPTAQAIIARVMTEEPRGLILQRRSVPEAVEIAVLTAIQKLPADRFRTPAEFRSALAGGDGTTVPAARVSRPPRFARRDLWWGGLAAAVAIGGFLAGSRGGGVRAPLVFGLARKVTWEPGLEIEPALSPDGRYVAYAQGGSEIMRIHVRQVSGGRPIPLSEDDSGTQTNPQWSPDGSRILFLSRGGVFSAPSSGGSARPELPAPAAGPVTSAAWGPDGTTIAYTVGDSLYLRPASGTTRGLATVTDPTLCQWAATGRALACVSGNSWYSRVGHFLGNLSPSRIVVIQVRNGQVTTVTDSTSINQSPVWSRDGRWLYFVSNVLGPEDVYAQAVTADGRAAGAPVRLTVGLGAHGISISADGTRIAYDVLQATANIWSLPFPPGKATQADARPLTSGAQVVEGISVSPDGEWVYFDSDVSGHSELYRQRSPNPVLPFFSAVDAEQLSFDSLDDFSPAVSPDGREVAFHSWRSGSRDVYLLPLGGGPEQKVVASPRQDSRAEWSPDGRAICYLIFGTGGLWMVRRDAAGHWGEPVERLPFGSWQAWSPDGRWLAFAEQQAGGSLLVAAPDSGAPRVLVDTKRTGIIAEEPHWSADGRTIYFKSHDPLGRAEFWAEPLSGGPPRLLIRFDDLSRPSLRPEWGLGGGRMYFTVNDRQSDIWVMEATPK